MSSHGIKVLSISQILLDPINPRHDPISSQRELIEAMLEDQKEKLVNLANDIVHEGINPSELPIVIPHNSEQGRYIVVEGNRRITALKLLAQPTLCKNSKFLPEFATLNKEFSKNIIDKISCAVFSDRESADHWVTLKHTGENKGVGTVKWNATNVRRHEALKSQTKPESKGLQLLNLILDKGNLDEKTKGLFRKIPITNVERLINDPKIRDFLGLELIKGEIHSQLSLDETINILIDFLAPFATKEKKVGHVYYKEDREKYSDLSTKQRLRCSNAAVNGSPELGADSLVEKNSELF